MKSGRTRRNQGRATAIDVTGFAGTPTIHKDLSLISLVPKWPGLESVIPLEEFLSIIESSACRGLWDNMNRQFNNGCLKLHSPRATWQKKLYTFLE